MDTPEIVIRPSPFNQPKMLPVYSLAIVAWIGCLYLVTHPHLLNAPLATTPPHRLVVGLYGLLVVIPVFIAVGLVGTRTHSIYLTATHIGHAGLSGRAIEHKRSDLVRIVLFSERYRYSNLYRTSVLNPFVAFETQDGAELFRVASRWWRLSDLRRLALACGVPLEGSWDDIREDRRV